MLIGSIATSGWLAYQSVSDRKKLLLAFAQFAGNDLEMSQRHVFSQVQDLAERWEAVLGLTPDPGGRAELIDRLEPVIVQRSEGNRYDLLLLLEKDGRVLKAVSPGATNRPVLAQLKGQHYSTVLGSSPDVDALAALLNDGTPVGISVRQFPAVNNLLGRFEPAADEVRPPGMVSVRARRSSSPAARSPGG